MTATPILAAVTRTPRGPVADFSAAVESQEGRVRIGRMYAFGNHYVRFWIHHNRLGADFFTPVSGQPGTYSQSRINTVGRRKNRGRVEINISTTTP